MPRKVSQQVQRLVDSEFKSFFGSLKSKNRTGVVRIPNYLDKINGRQVVPFTDQSISQNNRNVRDGYVHLSGLSFEIKTNVDNVKFARIVPNKNYITIELGYEIDIPEHVSEDRYASIDIGVNNLATITSNVLKPFIINGKPLKSINQFFNKRISDLSSKNKNKWSNRMYSITRKRGNKINDYMHKASAYVVNQLVENRVDTLVIGHNDGWKQDTKMHKDVKQTFIQIPFNKFIDMLTYKCQLRGIQVVIQEESYTSQSSFLNQDDMPIYGHVKYTPKFSGKRIHRGLYKTNSGIRINADVNGSYNIMRKYLTKQEAWNEKIFSDCVEVCSVPTVYTVKT